MINSNVSNFLISAFTNVPQTSQKTSVVEGTQKNPIFVENSREGKDSFNFSSTIDVDKYNSCKSPEEILVQLAKDGVVLDEPSYDEPSYDEPSYDEPSYDEPSYDEPSYDEPSYDESVCDEIQDLDSILPMDLPSVEDPYSYVDDISSNPFNNNSFAFGDDTSSCDPFNSNPFGF